MDRYVPLPPLPARISRLNELAYDLWWSWNAVARDVFRDLDYPLWRFTDHNPVLLLHLVEQERLEHAADDPDFLRLYDEAAAALDVVRAGAGTWWSRHPHPTPPLPIACVAPGFSLHRALPLDADGLAIVVGDFCKEASDLGVPLVGVGLMYPRGLMHQRLSGEGWQQESYEYLDWSDAPVGPALCPDGARCMFSLPLGGGDVQIQVWQVRAGRVTIYLLDTDLPANAAWNRHLSSASFLDDADASVRQRILLGAGAVRALALLGIEPGIWHVYDGASAFVAVERVHALVAAGTPFETALNRVRSSIVFQAFVDLGSARDHAPLAAIERHAAACWPAFASAPQEILALGKVDSDRGVFFSPTRLGARAAGVINAPGAGWVSPGVHVPSWIAGELVTLVERYLGDGWRERQDEEGWWDALMAVPEEELWQARQRLRGYLVEFCRERARRRWTREQSSGARLVALGTLLDATACTIGFARRFTGDLRLDFVFHDTPRLAAILTAARKPVQIIIAGRAHPADEAGKHRLQRMFIRALDPVFGGRIAFLEDYDVHAAHLLVQGCDMWLGAPPSGIAPLSELKAAINGAPVLRVDAQAQDAAAAIPLYRRLEEEIVPAFYERDRSGVPTAWVARVRDTIRDGIPRAGARRSVKAAAERMEEALRIERY